MSLLVDRSSSRIRRPNVVPQMARRRFVGEGGGILLAVMIVDFARREAVVVRTMAG